MKTNRLFPQAEVSVKQEARLKNAHPWVYADEILNVSEQPVNGMPVDVISRKGKYLGTGIWSEHSQIRIRILSRNANDTYDDAFFARRTAWAVEYRRTVMGEDYGACRLIHGEADGLPGVTVDRYGDLLVSEVLSYGMDLRRDVIYRTLKEELEKDGCQVRGIFERNEGELRLKEGLSQYKGWYGEPADSALTEITENGIRYEVDIENGQKTGFFLDQKYNRMAVRRIAAGRNVLDCCTHTGSFALNCAAAGAKSVTAVDVSASALETAKRNAQLNGLSDRISFVQADLFDLLPAYVNEHKHYDFVILDPPAFTKSRKTYRNAREGYRKINALGMRLVSRGGYLVTCSCSHFMPRDAFVGMLKDASQDAGVSLRIVEERHAAPDHPVLVSTDETDYLKFFLLQIV
ncbi:MAG: class I SAM-dependent rRNA methyltransferase [Solobacterium sp.]|nr:class I SAM-dependent rRNA methyltransferase [Solobacterium sp.]